MHTETFICRGGERVPVGKPCPVCGAAPAGEACGRAWRETDKLRAALIEIAREQSAPTATEAADRFQRIAREALK